jgi:hypothetical protein
MNLQERWTAMNQLRKHWLAQPGVQSVNVGYERYGMTSDLDYFEERMQQQKDAYTITELNWPNSRDMHSKIDRIQRLVPDFGHGKFYLIAQTDQETSAQKRMRDDGQPWRILAAVRRRDHAGNLYAINKVFLDEYLLYPFSIHDDLLDSISRIYDMDYAPAMVIDERMLEPETFIDS